MKPRAKLSSKNSMGWMTRAPRLFDFLRMCPVLPVACIIGGFLIGYSLLVNWQNGLEHQVMNLRRELALLRAEQDRYRLSLARQLMVDPELVEQTWNIKENKIDLDLEQRKATSSSLQAATVRSN